MERQELDLFRRRQSNHALYIMGKFVLPVYAEGTQGSARSWWYDWALADPRGAGTHVVSAWNVLNALREAAPDVGSCQEFFGGCGVQAVFIERLFSIKEHRIGEYSEQAFTHLSRLFRDRPHVTVTRQDSYRSEVFPCDLIVADFGDCTLFRLQDGDRRWELLKRCFSAAPMALVMTDVAHHYFHLHRARYEAVAGRPLPHYEDYLRAVAERVKTRFGYDLAECRYSAFSAVFGFVRNRRARGRIIRTPNGRDGLAILW